MVTVRIPTPLRKLTADQGEVKAEGKNIQDLIQSLNGHYPGLRERLVDEQGEVRRFVNIYVNEEDIRFLKGKETLLNDGDVVSIVPAIAGGSNGGGPWPI